MEAIAQNRHMRTSRFVEEKKWPPRELIGNPWREKTMTKATLTYSRQPSVWRPESDERLGQFRSHLHYPTTISGVSTPDFEPPFRLKVTFFFFITMVGPAAFALKLRV